MPTSRDTTPRPEIVFWSDFPLGYHNHEAEDKMIRFAERGHPVLYVEKIGIRNPGLQHVPRMLASLAGRRGTAGERTTLETLSPKLAFPRRAPLVPRLNRRLLERQVRARMTGEPRSSVFWLRYPSPELPALLDALGPRLVVYEAVDDHEHGPGISQRLRPLLRAAEDAILARAGLVFTWSEALRERFADRHPNVVVAGPAAELEPFNAAAGETGHERVALWTGSIDFRLDAELLAAVAGRLEGWRLVLAGPTLDEEAEARLRTAANIDLLGPVAADQIPSLVADSRVCVMPYRCSDFTDMLFPLKLVEYLAAGRPVVSTPIRIAREFDDVVVTAEGAEQFAAAVERGATSGADDRRRRVERASAYSWDARIDQMERALQEALRSAP